MLNLLIAILNEGTRNEESIITIKYFHKYQKTKISAFSAKIRVYIKKNNYAKTLRINVLTLHHQNETTLKF